MESSAFSVASWSSNRIDLLSTIVNQMSHTSWDASYGWQESWDSLGRTFSGPPTLISWGPNRLDAFGLDDATQLLMHNSWDGSSWEGDWTLLNDQTFASESGFAVVS